jgi:hypothetical protein
MLYWAKNVFYLLIFTKVQLHININNIPPLEPQGAAGWWFSRFTPPIKQTAMIDITEILLKVALNTTIPPPPPFF